MKNRFFARSCLLVGIVVGLWMCSKEPTVPPIGAKEPLYSVAKARAYYDGASCTTRTIAEPGPLTPGDYSLDWERAEVSLDSLLSSVDVPIDMQYRYYRYLQPETDSVELVPMYSKLVVVKEHPTLLEGCYIRYIMPARSMRSAYPDYDYDALLNSRPKTNFTGVSLYTDLNGWPMCVAYYYEGDLLFDAFLFDKTHTLEENIERLYNLIDDLTVARCSQARTRGTETNQDDGEPIDIENVIVTDTWQDLLDRLLTKLELENAHLYDLPQPDIGGSAGFGDSGSGGASSGNSGDGDGENNTSDHNSKIEYEDEETKELIEPLLDSISQDCMGKTLLDALDGVTIKTGTGRNGYDSETNTIELTHHNKYGYRDYVLLEELTHCYQRNRYGDMYVSKRLNAEIEAKVGWFLYRQRNPNALLDSSQSEWQQDAFYTTNGVKAMHQLAQHHLLETSIENSDYQNCYRNLAAALSVHRIDKNGVEHNAYATYSFSWDLQDWVFTCLQTLMENC
ncbi:MAG: hypothetical protein IKK86_04420 [Alistipes sp.]|nr:hypothetical protein [Alistipes sp.]